MSEWRNIFFTKIETIYYLPRARFIQNYLYLLSKNDAINFDKARIFQSLESVKSISLDAYSRTLAKNCQLFRHTVKAIKSSKQFKHCEKITEKFSCLFLIESMEDASILREILRVDLTNSRTFCPFLGSDNEVIAHISKNYCLKYVGKKLERPSSM